MVFIPTAHSNPEEKPPISENCVYQERQSEGLWRCYTQSERQQKQVQIQIQKEACDNSVWCTFGPLFMIGGIVAVVGIAASF